MRAMASAVQDLLDILDLEELDLNLFRGRSPQTGWQRVYGGQVIGQALVAAVRTVDASRPPHSMHAYFILPGDPKVPLIYDVDRIRDGKSFTTVLDKTGNPVTNYIEFDELPPTSCRYVRLTMTDWPRRPGGNLGIIEFTVFGKPVPTHGPRVARGVEQ